MERISSQLSRPLYDVATSRQIERHAAASLPPHTLMQRAGLAAARLTLALAPHAQHVWVACGPGNNGGDGFEAALHLHQWGKQVSLTWSAHGETDTAMPPDARASRQRALAAGVPLLSSPPKDVDFCVDALLGIGATLDPLRPQSALMAHWLELMEASAAPCLALDVPTGLNADSGLTSRRPHQRVATNFIADCARIHWSKRRFTLSFLTLKPGLFTASGRDEAGQVWFDDLGISPPLYPPSTTARAWLLGTGPACPGPQELAPHASHKGSFGDVAVIGGASSDADAVHMTGAALLAARAALHAGAGRVFVALLGGDGPRQDLQQPELMFRTPGSLDWRHQVIVCGCGGGEAVKAVLPDVLAQAHRAVLDADALNAIAGQPALEAQLSARARQGFHTVLTPHPLEAARLAGTSTEAVQADRLGTAEALAARFQCTVILKGSGSLVAKPGHISRINASGNALLATGGTGDVLAGMVGAAMARGLTEFEAACQAVADHGHRADTWQTLQPHHRLTASALAAWQAN